MNGEQYTAIEIETEMAQALNAETIDVAVSSVCGK
jgi:hypothetical protein